LRHIVEACLARRLVSPPLPYLKHATMVKDLLLGSCPRLCRISKPFMDCQPKSRQSDRQGGTAGDLEAFPPGRRSGSSCPCSPAGGKRLLCESLVVVDDQDPLENRPDGVDSVFPEPHESRTGRAGIDHELASRPNHPGAMARRCRVELGHRLDEAHPIPSPPQRSLEELSTYLLIIEHLMNMPRRRSVPWATNPITAYPPSRA